MVMVRFMMLLRMGMMIQLDDADADFGTILQPLPVKRQSLIALSEVLTIALLFPIAMLLCYF